MENIRINSSVRAYPELVKFPHYNLDNFVSNISLGKIKTPKHPVKFLHGEKPLIPVRGVAPLIKMKSSAVVNLGRAHRKVTPVTRDGRWAFQEADGSS